MLVKATRSGARSATSLAPEPFDVVGETALQWKAPIEIHLAQAPVLRQQAHWVARPRHSGIPHNSIASPIPDQAVGNVGHAGPAPRSAIDHAKIILTRVYRNAHQQADDV